MYGRAVCRPSDLWLYTGTKLRLDNAVEKAGDDTQTVQQRCLNTNRGVEESDV